MPAASARLPLSVVVITLNEEAHIADCLKSIAWADEWIVVDSGSTDRTVEIAEAMGAKVIPHDWSGYGAQKQFATEQACYDWILNLDADERITPELSASLQLALARSEQPAAYQCDFRHQLMGRWLDHGEASPDPHVRIYDRQQARWNPRPIHEQVEVAGRIERLAGRIEHCSADSVADFVAKINGYTYIQAKLLVESGASASLLHALVRPAWRFFRGYVLKLGFLDGVPGLTHAWLSSLTTFLKYAKAVELSRNARRTD